MLVQKIIPAPQKPKLKKPKNKVLPNNGAECPLWARSRHLRRDRTISAAQVCWALIAHNMNDPCGARLLFFAFTYFSVTRTRRIDEQRDNPSLTWNPTLYQRMLVCLLSRVLVSSCNDSCEYPAMSTR